MNDYTHLKPMIPYLGGKRREIQQILKYLPNRYSLYVEPFVGGGALFFYLNPVKSVISDKNTDLIELYKMVKNGKGEQLCDIYRNIKQNKTTFDKLKNTIYLDPLLRTAQYYYLNLHSYGSVVNRRPDGHYRASFAANKNITKKCIGLVDDDYYKLLQRTVILNKDFEYVFKKYNRSEYFIFLDPPYYDVKQYTNKFTDSDHIRLSNCFKTSKAMCLMIIADNPFIRKLYNGYIYTKYKNKYELHGYNNNKNTKYHLVIKNY